MSIYKPKNSPYYQFDFQMRGRRFHGSTGTRNKREAEKVEQDEREKAKALLKAAAALQGETFTLDVAFGRYWHEVGQHHVQSATTRQDLNRLLSFPAFHPNKLLTEITDDDITQLVAWRRGHRRKGRQCDKAGNEVPLVSAATVNRSTVQRLQAVFTRAKDGWGIRFDHEPKWSRHRLKEPLERVRELRGDEGDRLDAAMRRDYAPYFEFLEETGQRKSECRRLRWTEVDWDNRQIITTGKGGRRVVIPITPTVRAILWPLRGHHPEFVFTYVAQRTRRSHMIGGKPCPLIKGQRYPITESGLNDVWKNNIRKKAGLQDFRMHDLRHNFATKLVRDGGNFKLVQKVLNHADIKSTARYVHVDTEDVEAALDRVQKSRKKSRNSRRKAS